MIVFIHFSVPSTCSPSCQCKSAQNKVDKNGNCNTWCSMYGYCGDTDAYKEDGVDCRGCAGTERISVPSK